MCRQCEKYKKQLVELIEIVKHKESICDTYARIIDRYWPDEAEKLKSPTHIFQLIPGGKSAPQDAVTS